MGGGKPVKTPLCRAHYLNINKLKGPIMRSQKFDFCLLKALRSQKFDFFRLKASTFVIRTFNIKMVFSLCAMDIFFPLLPLEG
jgi:hypothetical protein